MLDIQPYIKTAELLKVLAHPYRLAIVHGLSTNACNVTTMQECLGIPQSTVSTHLRLLRAAGVITGERSGAEITYTVTDPSISALVVSLMGTNAPIMKGDLR